MMGRVTNVLVLAAGAPLNPAGEENYPACLTEFNGVPLLEWIVENAKRIGNTRFIFALRENEIEQFHLDRVAKLLAPTCLVVPIADGSMGSACTALMAACTLPADEEVLAISANEWVDIDLAPVLTDFRKRQLDGGLLTFPSVHPRYSYAKVDDDGLVTEVSQRRPISRLATTGTFWFARAQDLVESAKGMIRKADLVNGRYYIAKTYNEMILAQRRVGVHGIESVQYRPLKSERQISQFEMQGNAA